MLRMHLAHCSTGPGHRPRVRHQKSSGSAAATLLAALIIAVSVAFAAQPAAAMHCDVEAVPGYGACQGDCSGDGSVTVDELLHGAQIALGMAAPSDCVALDADRDGAVAVNEIVSAVNVAVQNCPPPAVVPHMTCPPGETLCNKAAEMGLGARAFGKGAAIVDVDGDGWDDIWESDSDNRPPDERATSLLYRNQHDGTFAPMDIGLPASDLYLNWSASFADYDNDGDPDALINNGGYGGSSSLVLYRNDLRQSGRFTNVTTAAGLAPGDAPWWGSSWADYDQDGYLDFAVTPVVGRVVLYHNLADGTFEALPITPDADMYPIREEMKNPIWFDYDLDGDPDLYVAGIFPSLYRNEGNGLFVDVSEIVMLNELKMIPFVFAAASDDFNQDGRPDLYLGRWAFQDMILLNQGDGSFVARSRDAGFDTIVGSPDSKLLYDDPLWSENTMGLGIGDFDADGMPDVFIGTGNPYHKFLDIIFCNASVRGQKDSAWFNRCSDPVVRGHGMSQTHGIALGDLDNDGDVDVFYNIGGMPVYAGQMLVDSRDPHAVYIRDSIEKPNTATIRLEGVHSNRDAIGSRIEVTGSETHYEAVASSQGFQSKNSSWKVLPLGTQKSGTVKVSFPLGGECELKVQAGDRLVVREPADAPGRRPTVARAPFMRIARPTAQEQTIHLNLNISTCSGAGHVMKQAEPHH